MRRPWLLAAIPAAFFCVSLPSLAHADPATLRPFSLAIDSGTKTATATAGAASLNKGSGIITTEALSTAAGATYVLTIANTTMAGAEMAFASVQYGTATTGTPVVTTVRPTAGTLVITVQNIHASAALNGTLKIAFMTLEP